MSDLPPQLTAALADRYRILRKLGEGGMATVYLAEDLKHARQVAVKVLKPELAAVVGAERFLSEIRTTANLQHPHILPLFDSGEAASFLYYVMPYVEGETLRDRIDREKQLPVDEAVAIGRKVASALDYAHRQGVIHRDIKPANILLQDGEPVVADFGIALAVQSAGGGRLTETGLSLGTPFYMSPEQATGDRDPDPRSDLYAVGCVTYEMLTGEPPFTGTTAQSVLAKILTDEAPVVTRVRKTVPPNVASAVAKATQRLPADRFPTAGAFAEALADPGFRFGPLLAEGAPGPGGTGGGPGGTGSKPWMAATGVFAAATAALAILALAGGSGSDVRDEPLLLRVVLPDSQAITHLLDVQSVALSDDGLTLAYVGPAPNNNARIWIKRSAERVPTPLPGTEQVTAFDLSPDGSEVVFISGSSRQIRVLSTAGGTPRTLVQDAGNRGLHWGGDGFVYFQTTNEAIARVPVAGGPTEHVVGRTSPSDNAAAELTWPWLIPGRDQLLVTQWGATGATDSIGVVDLGSGDLRILARGNMAQFVAPSHLLIGTNDGVLVVREYDPDERELVGVSSSLTDDVRALGTASMDFYAGADGTLLYVAGAGNTRSPAWVDRSGVSTLVREGWEGDFTDIDLARDGSRLVATQIESDRGDLWVLDLEAERAPPQRITFEGEGITRAGFTPNADTVLYVGAATDTSKTPSLMAVQWNGIGRPRELLSSGDAAAATVFNEVRASPDGRWIVYRVGAGDAVRDIFAFERGSTAPHIAVANSPASERAPTVSPDGRYVAYVSNESGRDEIYVRTFPDVTGGKWIVSTDGGTEPAWSSAGDALFYRDARDIMVEARWNRSGDGGVLGRAELFDTGRFYSNLYQTSYGVHPDGRFLMLEAANEDQLGLIWIQNFSASLTRDGS
jgi:serine/threonine-protein kinase